MDKSLKLSLLDAFLYSLMVGLGETYLPAYVLSIGMGEIYAGLLASLPLLSGALLQLLAPKGAESMKSTKSWIVFSTALQGFAFLPLVYFTLTQAPNFWVLFLILTLYWGAGFAASPAWNYWMGHLVPEQISHQFFARRSQILQSGVLLGLVLGGVALHNHVRIGPMTSAFTGIFVIAFACRVLSSYMLSQHQFLPHWESEKVWSLKKSWSFFWSRQPQNKFFIFLFWYQVTVWISSPFVSPYLLAQVKLDYGEYMKALAALMLGKIISLWWVSRLKKQFSSFDLLKIGLIGVSPLPALWGLSQNFIFMFSLQFESGFAWAFLEMGLLLIFFKDLNKEEKVPFLTFYNVLNSLGIIVGTGIGAIFLKYYGEVITTYWNLFIFGSFLRLISASLLYQQAKKWQNFRCTSLSV